MAKTRQTYQSLSGQRRTSRWRLLPWTGLVSILLAFGFGIATLVIGIASNGLPQNSWKVRRAVVQPSVLLSTAATLANAFIRLAFAEGVVLQWWLHAHQSVSLEQLAALYAHGYSFRGLFSMLPLFSRVTFAAFTMILLLLDGPFLQRASNVQPTSLTSFGNYTVQVASSPFALGATGLFTRHDAELPDLYSSAFAQVMQHYTARDPIFIPQLNYSGVLTMNITAPGWDVRCENGTSEYELFSSEDFEQTEKQSNNYSGPPMSQTMFNIMFYYNGQGKSLEANGAYAELFANNVTGTIMFNSSYKGTPALNGTMSWRSCSLNEALIRYPIQVVNGTVTLLPMPLSENRTQHLVFRQDEDMVTETAPSTLGGIWIALMNQFNTSANINFNPQTQTYGVFNLNAIASQYMAPDFDVSSYNVTWSDPTDSIIAATNEITLRAAINLTNVGPFGSNCGPTCKQPEVTYPNLTSVNRSISQGAAATMVETINVYQTEFAWLISSFVIMAFGCVAVAPMFWGWWKLERTFTLDPLETAKAFDAPLLQGASSALSPADWQQSLKKTRVYYGTATSAPPAENGHPMKNLQPQTVRSKGSQSSATTGEFDFSLRTYDQREAAVQHSEEVPSAFVSKFRKLD